MNTEDARRPLIVSAGVVMESGKIMLCQRRAEAHNGLKWEFPGGKLEPGETPEAALKRELEEELDIEIRVGDIVDAVLYRYPDRAVLVLFYACAIMSGRPRCVDCNAIAWATPEALSGYDFAGADAAFVERGRWRKLNTPI